MRGRGYGSMPMWSFTAPLMAHRLKTTDNQHRVTKRWAVGSYLITGNLQEFPQNLRLPVIKPFSLNALLSARSGIVAMWLARRKTRLRAAIRGDCGPLDEG
jgi:hypothetical protein